MNDYFKPLRRKIGVMTLVLACVFTAGWVRSLGRDEGVGFAPEGVHHWLSSFCGMVGFGRETDFSITPMYWYSSLIDTTLWSGTNPDGTKKQYDPWPKHQMKWRFDFAGFHFGSGTVDIRGFIRRTEKYIFPYWSIVIPLTILSAWLLLSKPKQSKSITAPAV